MSKIFFRACKNVLVMIMMSQIQISHLFAGGNIQTTEVHQPTWNLYCFDA